MKPSEIFRHILQPENFDRLRTAASAFILREVYKQLKSGNWDWCIGKEVKEDIVKRIEALDAVIRALKDEVQDSSD